MKKMMALLTALLMLTVFAGCTQQETTTVVDSESDEVVIDWSSLFSQSTDEYYTLHFDLTPQRDESMEAFLTAVRAGEAASFSLDSYTSGYPTPSISGIPVNYSVSFDGSVFTLHLEPAISYYTGSYDWQFATLTEMPGDGMVWLYLTDALDVDVSQICIGFYWTEESLA